MELMTRNKRNKFLHALVLGSMLVTSSCAMVDIPDSRNVSIPTPVSADARKRAVNERPDSVMYLPLGEDVLIPEAIQDDELPKEMVGPFELRGETLAGALQLILADYDISLAFETQEGLTRRITVANLRGSLGKVVHQVCSLANLYCSYEDGTITIKDRQTFTVTLPPLGTSSSSSGGSSGSSSSTRSSSSSSSSSGGSGDSGYLDDIAEGLQAILENGDPSSSSGSGSTTVNEPIVDATTRTIVYTATQRTADIANRYFQRLRANTAMIVFETYIWEVSLNSGNSTGIDWSTIESFGKFNTSFGIDGSVGADFLNPISIGLPTTQGINGTPTDLVQFLSQFGAVKTISQPQITVLSGSQAELRVADTQNYVSEISTTLDEGQATTSVNTDSVDTGFTLTIGSSWDKATVYANVAIELTNVQQIDDFTFSDGGAGGGSTQIQLPQTSERQLSTQIRVRPGDSVLIAGLVRENDNFDTRGIGLMKPFLPHSRTAQTENLELVILLRPRVIVYTAANDKRYLDYVQKKHHNPSAPAVPVSAVDTDATYRNVPAIEPAPLAPVLSPEPAPVTGYVPPLLPAPVVDQSPLQPPVSVTPSWDQGYAPPPSIPAPAPVVPAPAPILGQTPPPANVSRFGLGGGYVSRVDDGAAIPLYNADAAPAPAAVPSSPYETYDYYTPAR